MIPKSAGLTSGVLRTQRSTGGDEMREDFSALRIRLLNSDNPKVRALVTDVDEAAEIYERNGEPDHSQEQCQLARDLGIGDTWVIARWREGKVRRNEKVLAERRNEQ